MTRARCTHPLGHGGLRLWLLDQVETLALCCVPFARLRRRMLRWVDRQHALARPHPPDQPEFRP